MLKLICLDLDGTLEDSRADMTAAVHRVRAALGLPARTDDAVLPHVNKGMEALYRACFDDHLRGDDGAKYRDVERRYEADYGSRIAEATKLYDGAAQALAALGNQGRTAVVTNKPDALAEKLLESLGVAKSVGAVVGPGCGALKPDPRMMAAAAEKLGLVGAPAVMIGDTPGDIRLGQFYGAKTIWCAWGYEPSPGREMPDAMAGKPADLPGLVRDLLR